MPTIYLGLQSSSYSIGKVSVNQEPYKTSNLFLKFKHTPPSNDNSGNIYLFKTSWSLLYYSANSASLQLRSEYYNARLKHAEVYINRFDTNNTPLICVFTFDKGQDRIYINSEHGYLIDRNINTNITSLRTFNQGDQQKELLELLIKESDLHLNSVTYELDKTNPGSTQIDYNSGKISISPKQNVEGFSLDQIYKHTHTRNDRRFKKSFLLLNNNTPMASRDRPVRDIQGDEYDSINVYYNTKENIPIMIELVTKREKRHLHRISTDGLLWLRNDISNSRDALIKYLNFTIKYVEDKKVEEQQKRDRERSRGLGTVRLRETSQERGRVQVSETGPETEQGSRRTVEQGPEPTQTSQDALNTPSTETDRVATPPKSSEPSLNPKICVLIDKQEPYHKSDVQTICKPEPSMKSDTQIPDVQPSSISVDSSNLNNSEYKIYTHTIKPDTTKLNGKGQTHRDISIELSIYISNIGIFLYGSSGTSNDHLIFKPGQDVDELQVYFYNHSSKSNTPDTVPLMLHFDKKFYGPIKSVNYFNSWKRIVGIKGIADITKIKENLDIINRELNRIELSNTGGGKCSYGLRQYTGVQINEFPTERVKVTVQKKDHYTRVIHRTINSFTIGDIYYGTDDISKGKITIKGTIVRTGSSIITVDKSKNHTTQFITTSNPNTVVAYYHKGDEKSTLPQLIVLMNTSQPISDGTDPIKASDGSKYGYYVLATDESGIGYKYEWREHTDTKSPLTLNDETEFRLLNSVVILVEKQGEYREHDISSAVQSAKIKSPGNLSGVNRLKNRSITVNDCSNAHGTGENCVSKYRYKLFDHDLKTATATIFDIKPILGLRFLIPSDSSDKQYKQLTLYKDDKTNPENVDYLYHTINQTTVYVWFYNGGNEAGKGDPRPLMLCHNNTTYAPKNKESYFTQWVKVDLANGEGGLNDCGCSQGPDAHVPADQNTLLKELDRVVKFLNKVDIKEGTSNGQDPYKYTVHTFKSKQIQIQVTCSTVGTDSAPQSGTCSSSSSDQSCYKKFEHKSIGMNGGDNGSGYRLGEVVYNGVGGGNRTGTLDYTSLGTHKYYPLVSVSVFYYEHDKGYDDPLLIELEFKTNGGVGVGGAGPKEYYKLTKLFDGTGEGTLQWQKDEEASGKMGTKPADYLDKLRHSLKPVMKILIDQQKPYNLYLSTNAGATPGGYRQENGDKRIEVQPYTKNGCDKLAQEGYICYEHKISTIGNGFDYNKIGGLKLFLWDNRDIGKSENNDSECKSPKPTNKDKKKCCELTLYKYRDEKLPEQITYNTCMGDIYVYFYGSDPRPLLLIYNNKIYIPLSLDEYFTKWAIDDLVDNNDSYGSNKRILKNLVYVSNFLNPVYLGKTIEAYNKVMPIIQERRKRDKEKGTYTGKLGDKLPEHNYTVQTFSDTEIKMKVKSTDLLCYRQYTFESAMSEGENAIKRNYRLGNILYGTDNKRGATETCLTYPNHLPLQSVSLYYYMYDSDHRYPLIVQLDYGFGGPLDDYFRVCQIGASGAGGGAAGSASNGATGTNGASGAGAQSTQNTAEALTKKIAKNITWVKIKCEEQGHTHSDGGTSSTAAAAPSGSSTTSNGNCKDNCPSPTRPDGTPLDEEIKKELQLKDGEFVKRAHEIQLEMRILNQGDPNYGSLYMDVSSLFGHNYMHLVAELQWQIERRCYDVRKTFKIEYKKGDNNENLILATDENCHEDSIIGYVLGGGAVGVAGGGGWKFAVFALSMFIKL